MSAPASRSRSRSRARARRAPAAGRSPLARDRHALYEAAVQAVDFDLGFAARVYRRLRGRPAVTLREDFCGTAALSAGWVAADPARRAWGIDLDPEPLAWARAHRLPLLRGAAARLALLEGDVRRVAPPRVPAADLTLALNFSYWVFKTRRELGAYFRAARRGLAGDGVLVLNAFGGTEAMDRLVERKRVAARQAIDGLRLPAFDYVWRHERFNPVTHDLFCSISFELPGGRAMRRAFTYDWRLWTLPELRELLAGAGFRDVLVYAEGWDDAANEADNRYRRRESFENQAGWLAYVVGVA